MEIQYRRLTTIEDMHGATALIQKVWGEEGTISPFLFIAQSHVGALLLGAFLQEKLIGLNYGFIGKEGNEMFLYSHILAVDPDYRNHGIGAKLKELQKVTAQKEGLTKIVWTFDPLQSKNAYLNFHKLGTVSNQYKRHFYGSMTNEINSGTDSDRLMIEWAFQEEKRQIHEYTRIPCDIKIENDHPVINDWLPLDVHVVGIPVPDDIQQMKVSQPNEAKKWQLFLREMFIHYFEKGYRIVDFEMKKGRLLHYYVLERGTK
ncbi:GNAT family N-acetyltransferase [Bacillus timonensis]|nr:GNAT family N-acetyltransferase [Bacillus timonensis]